MKDGRRETMVSLEKAKTRMKTRRKIWIEGEARGGKSGRKGIERNMESTERVKEEQKENER